MEVWVEGAGQTPMDKSSGEPARREHLQCCADAVTRDACRLHQVLLTRARQCHNHLVVAAAVLDGQHVGCTEGGRREVEQRCWSW
jgi:hypothetical protein